MSFTELPKHWKWVKLGDVSSSVEYGSAAKSKATGRTPVLRMGNIQNGKFDWNDLVYTDDVAEIEKYLLRKNDVLFNRTNSPELVGKTAIFKGERPAIFAGYLIRINRIESLIDADYLAYFLNSHAARNYGSSVKSFGVNQSNINGTKLKSYPLPLPPLAEQQHIVAKLEELFSELDAGLASLKTATQQLKTYRQAVLKWAFEGKLTNDHVTEGELPAGWKWEKLGEVADKIFDGPFGSHLKSSDYVEAGVRVIRLENIGVLQFKDEYKTFVTEEKFASISKHTVAKGDIVFSSFIADEIRVTILPEFIDRAINKADSFCIRTSQENIDRRYLCYFLSTKALYNQLVNEIHGATRPRINTTQLKSSLIPLCSLEEQHRIVQEIESRLSVCDKLEETLAASLRQAEALRQSILKQAFAGKLVAPEKSDKLQFVAGSRNSPLAETSTN